MWERRGSASDPLRAPLGSRGPRLAATVEAIERASTRRSRSQSSPKRSSRHAGPWTWRSVCVCVAAAVGAGGCKEEVCPERFSVDGWCYASGACTVDGSVACRPDCTLGDGQVLRIPLATVAPQLGGHDLSVGCYGEPIPLPPSSIVIAIDGQVGMHSPGIPGESIVRWDAFPANPQEMTLSFDLATTAVLSLGFLDHACDLEHPIEPLSVSEATPWR